MMDPGTQRPRLIINAPNTAGKPAVPTLEQIVRWHDVHVAWQPACSQPLSGHKQQADCYSGNNQLISEPHEPQLCVHTHEEQMAHALALLMQYTLACCNCHAECRDLHADIWVNDQAADLRLGRHGGGQQTAGPNVSTA
jgi:hypothetical protein